MFGSGQSVSKVLIKSVASKFEFASSSTARDVATGRRYDQEMPYVSLYRVQTTGVQPVLTSDQERERGS